MREASAALILFVLVASLRFLSLTGFPDDHYVHLAGAQQMLHGEWPSRDFVDLGAPLTYAISAAAQAIFGQRQLTEALLMAAAFGLGAVLTLRAGVMLTGSLVFGLAAALIEVLVFPRTYSYPKIVLYSAAAVGLPLVREPPVSSCASSCLAGLVASPRWFATITALYIGVAALVAVALSPVSIRSLQEAARVRRACWPARCSSSCCRISSTCRRWTASSRTCSGAWRSPRSKCRDNV